MTPNDLITPREAAQRLHVAVGTLKRWRRCQAGPPWCRVGSRSIRYPVALLDGWLADQSVGVLPDPGAFSASADGPSGLTGIIPVPAADRCSQPRRWNFLSSIRPEGG